MKIGRHSYSRTENIQLCRIENFTSIGTGCVFGHGGNHAGIKYRELVSNFSFREFGWNNRYPKSFGGNKIIRIGNDVWIGQGVTIVNGVTISDGAIIGMNSMVAKDVPSYAVVVGNPMVIKRFRFSQEIIDKLLKIKWWNWTDKKIKKSMKYFRNIELFIQKYEN